MHDISIHAPLAGRDGLGSWWGGPGTDFNPRAPCGARPLVVGALTFFIKFQSTRPLRGATFLADIKTELEEFQSTRPLRGATVSWQTSKRSWRISIHAPLAGRDLIRPLVLFNFGISIHAPLAGRDAPL